MLKLKAITSALILISLFMSLAGLSQKGEFNEEDLIIKAQAFFEDENWTEALPLYAQLVSVYPDNAEYNFRYGVCSLHGDRADNKQPIRYLINAYQSMPDDRELLFYLGLAYYQNEEFSSALVYLNRCLEKLEYRSPERSEIEKFIGSCRRGMELNHKNLLDKVITKAEFQYDNFHRAYPPEEFDGALIQKPENFTNPRELKEGTRGFVYVSEPTGVLYFSGYLDEKAGQRDIFRVTLGKEGEWGNPQKLSGPVNTTFDEDYPVVTDDGAVLYFSSKGHNSIGGYDIFKSEFDSENGAFGQPENMGTGINSPFDDILFIPDRSGKEAYFASNRENGKNNITVFRIRLNDGMEESMELLGNQEKGISQESNEESLAQSRVNDQPAAEKPQTVASAGPPSDQPEIAPAKVRQDPVRPKSGNASPGDNSEGLRLTWELIFTEDDALETKKGSTSKSNVPANQVQTVSFTENKKSPADLEEDLEIFIEPDPIQPVQLVKYAASQPAFLEEDELLEIILEPSPSMKQSESSLSAGREVTPGITGESINPSVTDPVTPVQKMKYANSQSITDADEATPAIRNNGHFVKQGDPVEYVSNGNADPEIEEVPVNGPDAQEPGQSPAVEMHPIKPLRDPGEISSLTAFESGMLIFPEPVFVPMATTSKGSYQELVSMALNNPNELSYEELLFAASMASNPDDKLDIYYATFIRSERDWRAYYNAGVAARSSSDPGQAEVYLYQATLIYSEELVGQVSPVMWLKIR